MAGARAGGADERPILAVGELLAGLKGLIEHHVGRVFVVGEISNLHQARSGHSYFTLKDETGQIRAALFRGNARQVRFDLEEGLEVVAEAEVSIYVARGELQLVVRGLEPRGVGALQLAFQKGSSGPVAVASSQFATVAVLLAVTFNRERMRWWQAVGVGLTALAVALIAAGT